MKSVMKSPVRGSLRITLLFGLVLLILVVAIPALIAGNGRTAQLIVVEGSLIRNTLTSSWDNRDDGLFEGYSSFTFEVETPVGKAGKVLTLSYDKWLSPWKQMPKKRGRKIGMILPEWALDMRVVSFTEVRRMWLIGPRRPVAQMETGKAAFSF